MKLFPTVCNIGKFRTAFEVGGREVAHWFPGHMAKGLRQMREHLKKVDCVLEIHDARIPFTGRNPILLETLGIKPHLLILNKMDLADLSNKQTILSQLEGNGARKVIFTSCLKAKDDNIKKVVPAVMNLLANQPRFNRDENEHYCMMVTGVPNVGKSSFINSLRSFNLKKGQATRVGGEPGITKSLLNKIQVCEQPLIYLLDTPGVLPPKILSVETGLKLAVCGTILDHVVGGDIIADYLLYSLNRLQKFCYVDKYGLEEPTDDIQHILKHIAIKLRKTQRVKAITGVGNVTIRVPDYTAAACDFVRAFRKGELGSVMLD